MQIKNGLPTQTVAALFTALFYFLIHIGAFAEKGNHHNLIGAMASPFFALTSGFVIT